MSSKKTMGEYYCIGCENEKAIWEDKYLFLKASFYYLHLQTIKVTFIQWILWQKHNDIAVLGKKGKSMFYGMMWNNISHLLAVEMHKF